VTSLSNSLTSTNNNNTDIGVTIFVLPGLYQGANNQNLTMNIGSIVNYNNSNNNNSTSITVSFVAIDPLYGATTVLISPSSWFLSYDLLINNSSSSQGAVVINFELSGFTVYATTATVNNTSSSSSAAAEDLVLNINSIDQATLLSLISSHQSSIISKRDSLLTRLNERIEELDRHLMLYSTKKSNDSAETTVEDKEEEDIDNEIPEVEEGKTDSELDYQFMGATEAERRYARLKSGIRSLLERRGSRFSLMSKEPTTAMVMITSSSSSSQASLSSSFFITNCSFEGDALALSIVSTSPLPNNDTNHANEDHMYITNNSSNTVNVVLQDSSFSFLSKGAIYTVGAGILLQISSCVFDNNTGDEALGVGGALVIQNSAVLNVTDSSFVGNFALLAGGAIFASSNASLWIDSSLFEGNFAPSLSTTSIGGAVFVMSDATASSESITTMTINRSTFRGNMATIGGALASEGVKLTVTECLFESNKVIV